MLAAGRRDSISLTKGDSMDWNHMSGWGWMYGSLTMVIVIGAVVYAAVRLAQRRNAPPR